MKKIIGRGINLFNNTTAWLDRLPEWRLRCLLAGFLILFLLAGAAYIERDGDNVYKWGVIRYLVDTGRWYISGPDHHVLRWGIIYPVIWITQLCGTSPLVYYIFPGLSFLFCGMMVYLVARRAGGTRLAGIAAFLVFLVCPITFREGTQYFPMLTACLFILLMFYFLLRYLEKGKLFWTVASGLMLVAAYGCKETSLYWAPGVAFFLLFFADEPCVLFKLGRMRISAGLVLFTLVVTGGFIGETLILNHLFDCRLGRFELLKHTHLNPLDEAEPGRSLIFWLFSFLRPLDIHGKYYDMMPRLFLLIIGLVSMFLCLFKGNRKQKLLAVALFTAYMLHCYLVLGAFPFRYPERSHARYFMAVLVIGFILYTTGQELWRRYIWNRISDRRVCYAAQLVLLVVWLVPAVICRVNTPLTEGHMVNVIRQQRRIAQAMATGTPIVYKLDRELDEGRLSSKDSKRASLYQTFFFPVEVIPGIKVEKLQYIPDGDDGCVVLTSEPLSSGEYEVLLLQDGYRSRRMMMAVPQKTGRIGLQ